MAFNGSGVFNRLYSFVQDKINGVKISSSRMDGELDGIATGLSNCITKDGQTAIAANIPFNNRKITGLGDATSDTDGLNRQTADGRYLMLSKGSAQTVADPTTFSDMATFSKAANFAKGANIASAATPDIGAATGNFVHITGTTAITGFATAAAGITRTLVFDGALTLTHNATSLILPGGANITTAAGDTAEFVSEGSGNWRSLDYQRASGLPITGDLIQTQTISSAVATVDFTSGIDSTYDRYELVLDGVVPSADDIGIRLQFFSGGAWQTANYNFSQAQVGPTLLADSSTGTSAIWLTRLTVGGGQGVGSTAAYGGANLRAEIIKPADATVHTQVAYQGAYARASDGQELGIVGGGRYAAAAAVSGFRISASTGNLVAGRISLYGVRKS